FGIKARIMVASNSVGEAIKYMWMG
ncbi:MAG: hypothetical protein ACI945_001634, partial [Pseudohongiellaceae bacterium]